VPSVSDIIGAVTFLRPSFFVGEKIMHRKKMSLCVASMVSMSAAFVCLQLSIGTVPSASGNQKGGLPSLANRVAALEQQQQGNELMFELVDLTLQDVDIKLEAAEQRTTCLRARVRVLEGLLRVTPPTDNQ
jgi:hypothetical protein